MGRIKTKMCKRLTFELLKKYKDKLSANFDENKKIVSELLIGASKKVRNTVAGYVTRLMKTKEDY
jgi:small subunit ribosomal protein S17e